ncbi:MAG: hypothetical protein HRT45_11005 [Bdellovibrionales bacterium]|nr:hypothetical protein [Bdellovibrionales bacterium]
MLKNLFFALVCISLLNGCAITYSYKTKDIKKQTKKMDKQLRKFDNQLVKDYEDKASAYKVLIESGADESSSPYPQLNAQLKKMKEQKLAYQKSKSEFGKVKGQMLSAIKGKKKVKSNEPEFKKIEAFRDTAKKYNEVFRKEANAYVKSSNKFMKIIKANKIYKVDVKQLKSKVDKSFKNAKAAAKKNRDIHNKNKKKAAKFPDKLALLKKVDMNLDKMDALTKQAEVVSNEFVKEVGKQKTAFVAPHMKSHTVMAEMNEISKQIKTEGDKAMKVYKQLK